ncbi:MAG: polysaccharide deacetylase family protein [Oscillospiraceae bacterium]|nr:polysaccharide deacetylase family protein [Oscillospiraceae bacterium]
MNRLFSLSLALLLLLTGCVGRAAPPAGDGGAPLQTEEITATANQAPEPAPPAPPEPEPEEEPQEPEEPYVRVIDPAGPMVALTFDDGPHQIYTAQLLDILEEHHAVATFFEVGRNVALYPDSLPRMAELGCEIASHSNAHRDLSKLRKASMLQDLDAADQAFLNAGVAAPTLVRPPYGAVNKSVKNASGRTVVTWTVDTQDWMSQDAQTVIDYVQSLSSLDGEIVLLHSTYESTVQAMAVLVPWLQEQGYQLVTVSELMAYYYGQLLEPDQFYGYTYFSTHARTDTPLELPAPPEETGEEAPAEEALPGSSAPEVPGVPGS